MKNKINKLLLLSPAILCALVSATGCKKRQATKTDEEIDSTKTQIRIHNFGGGYGITWLTNLKRAFEAEVANISFEPGKTGVQITTANDKNTYKPQEIKKNESFDLFFLEQAEYVQYVDNDAIEDITSVVTGENEYDNGKKIIDKYTEEQKGYYSFGSEGSEKIYAIPHYSGGYFLNYDIDLFDKYNFYFKEGHPEVINYLSIEDYTPYFCDTGDTKTKGPDGKTGLLDGIDYSADDGLPETFQEFYLLCKYLKSGVGGKTVTPLVHTGKSIDYVSSFMSNMCANIDGIDTYGLNYSFDSNGTNVKLLKQADPSQTEEKAITEANGYDILRTKGRKDTIDFITSIMTNNNWYYSPYSQDEEYTNINAQRDFVRSGVDGKTEEMAMLLDGSWWQTETIETSSVWDSVKQFGTATNPQTPEARRFGIMPFPKATQEEADEHSDSVYLDHLNSAIVVRKGVTGGVKDAIFKFLKFANSDEQLRSFTSTTSVTKALNYELTNEDKEKMTPYGLNVYNYKTKSKILFPVSKSDVFKNHQDVIQPAYYWKMEIDTRTYGSPAAYIMNNSQYPANLSSTFFNGLCAYYKNNWNTLFYNR